MTMIVWSKSAYADLKKAATSFIKQGNSEMGREIILNIGLAAERLAQFPLTGRKGRVEGTRELLMPRLPYLMVYLLEKSHKIKIVRVLTTDVQWPAFQVSPEQAK
jgi:addiction module RelE/StbE family toxin